jgi:hypothetical protein
MSKNRVLRRIFWYKRDEVTGEWRKIHNEELDDLYCSPIVVRVKKSRRMGWAVHVARMGTGESCTGFWWGNHFDVHKLSTYSVCAYHEIPTCLDCYNSQVNRLGSHDLPIHFM